MFATAYIRAFALRAAACGMSSAVIFIDIRSAFHAMVREIVLGTSTSLHPKLLALLEGQEADLPTVVDRTQNSPDLAQLGLPECAARLFRDAHRHTWYTLGASDCVHQTERGSRPGSPLADVAFNGLMALVLDELQQRLDASGPMTLAYAQLGHRALPVAWVDDVVASRSSRFSHSVDPRYRDRGMCLFWTPAQPQSQEN